MKKVSELMAWVVAILVVIAEVVFLIQLKEVGIAQSVVSIFLTLTFGVMMLELKKFIYSLLSLVAISTLIINAIVPVKDYLVITILILTFQNLILFYRRNKF